MEVPGSVAFMLALVKYRFKNTMWNEITVACAFYMGWFGPQNLINVDSMYPDQIIEIHAIWEGMKWYCSYTGGHFHHRQLQLTMEDLVQLVFNEEYSMQHKQYHLITYFNV